LDVMVQVNTSGEASKSGLPPNSVEDVVEFVTRECPRLRFLGLMTIGSYDARELEGPDPDFVLLAKVRDAICKRFELIPQEVELSMGMSQDFGDAIVLGSTNVRVGSTIFGQRS